MQDTKYPDTRAKISVAFSDARKAEIEKTAEELGFTTADYIRHLTERPATEANLAVLKEKRATLQMRIEILREQENDLLNQHRNIEKNIRRMEKEL